MNARLPQTLLESLPARVDAPGVDAIATAVPFFPARLRRRCRIVACDAGGRVVFGGKSRQMTYRLLRGEVEVRCKLKTAVAVLQSAAPGDWLIAPEWRTQSVEAVCHRASMLLAVPAKDMTDALAQEPDFAHAWRMEIEAQFARLQRRVERLNLYHSSQRVAHYLATEGIDGELMLPFMKRTWAWQLGMAPETLSRTLTDMMADGTIERTGDNRYRLRAWPKAKADRSVDRACAIGGMP